MKKSSPDAPSPKLAGVRTGRAKAQLQTAVLRSSRAKAQLQTVGLKPNYKRGSGHPAERGQSFGKAGERLRKPLQMF
ncbi:MAG: hypothetical protein KME26_08480 [Oscillatoria princeps RMCB-10]|nr:hypothetical protein [Oscillatoria princeps RMCB-10]